MLDLLDRLSVRPSGLKETASRLHDGCSLLAIRLKVLALRPQELRQVQTSPDKSRPFGQDTRTGSQDLQDPGPEAFRKPGSHDIQTTLGRMVMRLPCIVQSDLSNFVIEDVVALGRIQNM